VAAMKKYHMVFLYRGPFWTAQESPDVIELSNAHLNNIEKLVNLGKMTLAGPFEVNERDSGKIMAGIFILNTESIDSAHAWVRSDPAVQKERFTYEIRPWWGPSGIHYISIEE
jgi:uncharacterized protein YciI